MRILDLDPEKIWVTRQPGNHRKVIALETRAGELMGVELTDDEAAALAQRLVAVEAKPE